MPEEKTDKIDPKIFGGVNEHMGKVYEPEKQDTGVTGVDMKAARLTLENRQQKLNSNLKLMKIYTEICVEIARLQESRGVLHAFEEVKYEAGELLDQDPVDTVKLDEILKKLKSQA